MKIYTKTGDKGETGLYGADRVPKTHPRVEAYGTVDELNSLLGVVRAFNTNSTLDQDLAYLQNALFDVGADLATRDDSAYRKNISAIDETDILKLEGLIDTYTAQTPELKHFILPAGNLVASHLQLARAVARRAERAVIAITEPFNLQVQIYLNRLSDLLFVMARAANTGSESLWQVKGRR